MIQTLMIIFGLACLGYGSWKDRDDYFVSGQIWIVGGLVYGT